MGFNDFFDYFTFPILTTPQLNHQYNIQNLNKNEKNDCFEHLRN